MSWIAAAISAAISLGVLIVGLAIIEAMKRRSFDPVGRIAGFLSPTTTTASPLSSSSAPNVTEALS